MQTRSRHATGHNDAPSETPIFDEVLSTNGIAWRDEPADPPAEDASDTTVSPQVTARE